MERVRTQRDVRRAIHRSRAFRARLQRKRRRSVLLGAGAAAAALIGLEISVAGFGGMTVAEAATNQAKSLMDLLGERSPGERTADQLTKTARKLADRDRPAVVPKNLAEVLAPPPEIPAVDIATPPTELAAFAPPPPGAFLLPPPGGGTGGNPPPGGGIIVPPAGNPQPGGGNPPPNQPPGPPDQPPGPPDQPPGPPDQPPGPPDHPPGPPDHPPPPPDQPPPLPEPGTWMTMIVGFGMVGWQMRRNRRALTLN